jgi:hypothetical protein
MTDNAEKRLDLYSLITDQIYRAINAEDKALSDEILRKVLSMVDKLVYLEEI